MRTSTILTMALALGLAACNGKPEAPTNANDDNVGTASSATSQGYTATNDTEETVENATGEADWNYALKVTEQTGSNVSLHARALPSATPAANASMIRWIAQQLDCAEPRPTLQALLEECGRRIIENDSAEIAQLLKEGAPEHALSYEHNMKIGLLYANKQYITLSCTWFHYLGGAHGGTQITCATFDRQDGHVCGWELLGDMSRAELGHAIKSALMPHFGVDTESALYDCLLLESDDPEAMSDERFPLPSNPPYLTPEGVNVIYQQYEIAPYSAGSPTGVIRQAVAE